MDPLEGVKVVDLTRILAGPYCTSLSKGALRRAPLNPRSLGRSESGLARSFGFGPWL